MSNRFIEVYENYTIVQDEDGDYFIYDSNGPIDGPFPSLVSARNAIANLRPTSCPSPRGS
jgi:hypothetical protein